MKEMKERLNKHVQELVDMHTKVLRNIAELKNKKQQIRDQLIEARAILTFIDVLEKEQAVQEQEQGQGKEQKQEQTT